MNIVQFKLEGIDEREHNLVPEFCRMIQECIYTDLNTYSNRAKIEMRIPYLYKCDWIIWYKKQINIQTVLKLIFNSIEYKEYKNNRFTLYINETNKIPNTNTYINRLIRFLEYGDTHYKGLGLFTMLEHRYNRNISK